MALPEVWEDVRRSRDLGRERSTLERLLRSMNALDEALRESAELLELTSEEGDQAMLLSIREDLDAQERRLVELEFQRMFSGEMDANDAWLSINAGSGGTEAQDWADMLLRMYLRWCERRGFETEISEISSGEVAGIKSASFRIRGDHAYGWLRTESGVHRLVRKSPFDSGNRRHTSFAAIFVAPDIDEDVEIDVNAADLRIDTYRASGAGGQHVNKTDSAVRITHLPTGIVSQCQNQRSQHQNRDFAMRQLRARLYEREMSERRAEREKLEEGKADIGWGSQIRSYVLDDARIKDLRTGEETTNCTAVLDGDIDRFIESSLKRGV